MEREKRSCGERFYINEPGRLPCSAVLPVLRLPIFNFLDINNKSEPISDWIKVRIILFWWTRRDSNPRLLQCECSTLPTELRALIWRKYAYNKFSILLIKCFVNQAKTSAERGRTGVFCSFNLSCMKTLFESFCCFIFQLK